MSAKDSREPCSSVWLLAMVVRDKRSLSKIGWGVPIIRIALVFHFLKIHLPTIYCPLLLYLHSHQNQTHALMQHFKHYALSSFYSFRIKRKLDLTNLVPLSIGHLRQMPPLPSYIPVFIWKLMTYVSK